MAEKTSYRGHTIFKETYKGKTVYRLTAGMSKTRYTSLTGAKRAIDRYIAKYHLRG